MEAKKPVVGFIGLGIMGLAMALNVKKAGYPVLAFNRSSKRRSNALKEGLSVADSPRELASQSEVIVLMVTDSEAVNEVLNGPDGVFKAATRGKSLIQMSTIDGPSTIKFAKQAVERGMKFLDCPVTGSKKQVEEAQLILLAAGDEELIHQWKPVLMAMGKAIVPAGGIGMGTALKLCMNLIVAQMTTALCETVALAKSQGLEPSKIFDVIGQSPALNCGYYQIKKKNLLDWDFTPAFSLKNMLKDVRFMNQAARLAGLSLPVIQAVQAVMTEAQNEGLGDEDLTVIAKILDGTNNITRVS